jgi:hypothetical protein
MNRYFISRFASLLAIVGFATLSMSDEEKFVPIISSSLEAPPVLEVSAENFSEPSEEKIETEDAERQIELSDGVPKIVIAPSNPLVATVQTERAPAQNAVAKTAEAPSADNAGPFKREGSTLTVINPDGTTTVYREIPVKDSFSKRIQINGGAGSDNSCFGNGELSLSVSNYFDLALRFLHARGGEEPAERLWWADSHWKYYETTEKAKSYNGDFFLVFNSFRGKTLAPFAGVGLGYASMECPGAEKNDGASLVLRAGIALNYRRLTIKGEYLKHDNASELVGDFCIMVTHQFGLHAIVEKFDFDDTNAYTMFGGGVSLDF